MPKLSAILSGSTVNIPLNGGGSLQTVKVTDNHYGKGETVLLATKELAKVAFPTSWYLSVYEPNAMDFQTGTDLYSRALADTFAETIKKSLIWVDIGSDLMPGCRACFLPSIHEFGLSGVSAANTDVNPLPSSGGKTMSNLRERMLNLYSNASTRTFALRNMGRTKKDSSSYSIGVYANMYVGTSNLTTFTYGPSSLRNSSSEDEDALTLSGRLHTLITIDSNVEVAGSTGGSITNPMALESYRKIDGVWYRTI